MATYQKPTEDLKDFNSSVFKTANSTSLTLSQAQALFLGRTGTPNSTATATTFNGSLSTQLNSTFNGVNVGKGTGVNTTVVGNGATTVNNYCTSIGSNSTTSGSTSIGCATALGYQSNAGGDGAVALGYNASAGENSVALGSNSTATVNQIVLGTTGSTVICKGTASSISLTTARNLSINGAIFGVGAAGSNSLFSGLTTGGGNGSGITLYGSGSYANSTDGSSFRNTVIGALAMTNTNSSYSDSTIVGYGSQNTGVTAGTADKITILGASASCANSNSTAIGYGATSTLLNQIMLGTSTETVYCSGTQSGISLKASTNLSVNGMVFGTGSNGVGNGNIFIGQTSGTNGNGTTNTVVGHGAFTSAINTSSTGNTFIGSNAGKDITATVTTCTIVGQGSYINTATAYNGASCLGYDCQIGGANSTAIGTGAVTGVANQIVLGRSTEFVECAGTNTTNGCLKLNGGLKLQTTYGAVPSATMLGYRIELVAVSTGAITSLTAVSIGALALTVGVWILSYTFELTNTVASTTATSQAFYFSNTNGGALASRRDNTGTVRVHTSNIYGVNDVPMFSGCGTYYASASISLYPTVLINYSGGTLTGLGYASAVRIG